MSELTERARTLVQSVRRDTVAVDLLAQAVEALCDELERHQHGYIAPRDANMMSRWSRTRSEETP